jgi:glucose/arabinose dehydrogenase
MRQTRNVVSRHVRPARALAEVRVRRNAAGGDDRWVLEAAPARCVTHRVSAAGHLHRPERTAQRPGCNPSNPDGRPIDSLRFWRQGQTVKVLLPALHTVRILVMLACAHTAAAQSAPSPDSAGARWTVSSDEGPLEVTVIATGFSIPTTIVSLPDGSLLVADRHARTLTRVNIQRGERQLISGLPDIWIKPGGTPSQGAGLHDVRLAPDFGTTGVLYLSYSVLTSHGSTLAIARGVLRDDRLQALREIYRQPDPVPDNTDHFGGRMVLTRTDLFVTTGDRYAHRDSAQRLTSTLGKVLRLRPDGRVPADNPFRAQRGARPEIWSLGHRNPQGLALHPQTGALWLTEHGPRGGDEVNIVHRGRNYGWPLVTYGEEYEGGPVGSMPRSARRPGAGICSSAAWARAICHDWSSMVRACCMRSDCWPTGAGVFAPSAQDRMERSFSVLMVD